LVEIEYYDKSKHKLTEEFKDEVYLFIPSLGMNLVIIYDGKIVGGIEAYKSGGEIFLSAIYVLSSYSGKGIGKDAISKLFDFFGSDIIIGEATEDSIGFWKSIGAKFTDSEKFEFELTRDDFMKNASIKKDVLGTGNILRYVCPSCMDLITLTQEDQDYCPSCQSKLLPVLHVNMSKSKNRRRSYLTDEVENKIMDLTNYFGYSLDDPEVLVDELSVLFPEYEWSELFDMVMDYERDYYDEDYEDLMEERLYKKNREAQNKGKKKSQEKGTPVYEIENYSVENPENSNNNDKGLPGGLADGVPDDEFDRKQLEKGINVELEHTDDPEIAKDIAKDHLMEMNDYYDRLEEMEEEAKKEKTKGAKKRIKSRIVKNSTNGNDILREKWEHEQQEIQNLIDEFINDWALEAGITDPFDDRIYDILDEFHEFKKKFGLFLNLEEFFESILDNWPYEESKKSKREIGKNKVIGWIWKKAERECGKNASEKDVRALYNKLKNKYSEKGEIAVSSSKRIKLYSDVSDPYNKNYPSQFIDGLEEDEGVYDDVEVGEEVLIDYFDPLIRRHRVDTGFVEKIREDGLILVRLNHNNMLINVPLFDVHKISKKSYNKNYSQSKYSKVKKIIMESKKNSMTDEAQKFISDKIRKLMDEGKPQNQAIAIAYEMARERGYDVPNKPKKSKVIDWVWKKAESNKKRRNKKRKSKLHLEEIYIVREDEPKKTLVGVFRDKEKAFNYASLWKDENGAKVYKITDPEKIKLYIEYRFNFDLSSDISYPYFRSSDKKKKSVNMDDLKNVPVSGVYKLGKKSLNEDYSYSKSKQSKMKRLYYQTKEDLERRITELSDRFMELGDMLKEANALHQEIKDIINTIASARTGLLYELRKVTDDYKRMKRRFFKIKKAQWFDTNEDREIEEMGKDIEQLSREWESLDREISETERELYDLERDREDVKREMEDVARELSEAGKEFDIDTMSYYTYPMGWMARALRDGSRGETEEFNKLIADYEDAELAKLSDEELTSIVNQQADQITELINRIKIKQQELDALKSQHKEKLKFFSRLHDELNTEIYKTEQYMIKIKKWSQKKSKPWKQIINYMLENVNEDLRKQFQEYIDSLEELDERIRVDVTPKNVESSIPVSGLNPEFYAYQFIEDSYKRGMKRSKIWSEIVKRFAHEVDKERLSYLLESYHNKRKAEGVWEKIKGYVKRLWDSGVSLLKSLRAWNKELEHAIYEED